MTIPTSSKSSVSTSYKTWKIWNDSRLEFNNEIKAAINGPDHCLLDALGINNVDEFTQGDTVSLVYELLQLDGGDLGAYIRVHHSTLDCILQRLRKQLEARFDLNAKKVSYPLLGGAIENGRKDSLLLLLSHGADPSYLLDSKGTLNADLFSVKPLKEVQSVVDFYRLMDRDQSIYFGISSLLRDASRDFVDGGSVSFRIVQGRKSFGDLPSGQDDIFSMAWIHIPNIIMPAIYVVADAIQRSYNTHGIVDFVLGSFKLPAVLPHEAHLSYLNYQYATTAVDNMKTSIMIFPCFVLQSVEEWQTKRNINLSLQRDLWPQESPPTADLMRVYLDRTLDEASYPRLSPDSLREKNNDQVIQNQYKRENRELQIGNTQLPILTIPQLWIWKMDHVMVSAYSMASRSSLFAEAPNDSTKLQPMLSESRGITTNTQIALLLKDCVEKFGEPYHVNATTTYQPTLDIFETALVSLFSDIREYVKPSDDAGEMSSIDIKKEQKFILNIADINDELDMIGRIVEQQKSLIVKLLEEMTKESKELRQDTEDGLLVVREFRENIVLHYDSQNLLLRICQNLYRTTVRRNKSAVYSFVNGSHMLSGVYYSDIREELLQVQKEFAAEFDQIFSALHQAIERLDGYATRIANLNREASRVSKTLDAMLDLRRTHASVRLAESSIKLAQSSIEEAHKSVFIGLVALGFAIVTIIFTPLSFVTSLLALPSYAPDKHPVLGQRSYVSGILVGTEFGTLVFTGLCVWLASLLLKRSRDKDSESSEQTNATQHGTHDGQVHKSWHNRLLASVGFERHKSGDTKA